MLGGKTDHHLWRWTHSWPCSTNHMFKPGQWKQYLHMWGSNEQGLHSQVCSTCSPWNHSLQNCLVTLTLSSRRYGVSFARYNLIYCLMLVLGDLPVWGVWSMKKRHIKVIMSTSTCSEQFSQNEHKAPCLLALERDIALTVIPVLVSCGFWWPRYSMAGTA